MNRTRALSTGSSLWLLVGALVLVGCGGDEVALDAERVEELAPVVQQRLADADIDLELSGARCVTEALSVEGADEVAAGDADVGLSDTVADSLAAAVLSCADSTEMTRSALAPFTQGAADSSVTCAADRLDDALIAEVVAANLRQDPLPAAQVELEIAVALGLCFEPEELLDRG